jgi:putative ABC transport system ATP-binding protein
VSAAAEVLALRDVAREFRMGDETVHALRGVSFDVAAGEWVAVVGPSGCGKSTLLNLLGAVDRPTRGTVRIGGQDVGAMRDREATAFRLRRIGFVFQRFYLMPTLTARENVELPMAEAGASRQEREARARELLAYVGLAGRERHRPAQLSGGEQQRVAIARALANRPALLLADEPTGELDARTGQEIIQLFRRLNADGTTLVVVTHDETLADAGRRVLHMRDGLLVRDTGALRAVG